MKNNNDIEYMDHSRDSVFASLDIRTNPEDAFKNAIAREMKNPDDWMYMYSKNGRDYFKHCDYRTYKSYLQHNGHIKMGKLL